MLLYEISSAGAECDSPGRQPWVKVGNDRVPQGRHRGSHAHTQALR